MRERSPRLGAPNLEREVETRRGDIDHPARRRRALGVDLATPHTSAGGCTWTALLRHDGHSSAAAIGACRYRRLINTEIVFETHAWTEDNERGVATGWGHGRLAQRGEGLARELGERRRDDQISAVFVSDLYRAVQTAELAFEGTQVPILHDWRLRECDYGDLNGRPARDVHSAVQDLEEPYPGGESWVAAMDRVARFVDDLPLRWAGERVLVIGHIATLWGLARRIDGIGLADVRSVSDPWREGWEFTLEV